MVYSPNTLGARGSIISGAPGSIASLAAAFLMIWTPVAIAGLVSMLLLVPPAARRFFGYPARLPKHTQQ